MAHDLFHAIQRDELVVETAVTVVAETIHVMTTTYGVGRTSLVEGLGALLALDAILLPGKRQVLEAMQLWARIRRLSFPDAFHLVLARHSTHKRIASFDKGMGNVLSDVTRIEQLP